MSHLLLFPGNVVDALSEDVVDERTAGLLILRRLSQSRIKTTATLIDRVKQNRR